MFDIIPGGAKLYNLNQLSQTIGCKITDFHKLLTFINAWVNAFHPPDMRWFNPCGPDTSIKWAEPEYSSRRSR